MKNETLKHTRDAIPYHRCFRPWAKSVVGCILMQQLDYWFAIQPDGFYKFLLPCPNHPQYSKGDSWQEELAVSADEFRSAFDNLGTRYKSKGEYEAAPDKFQGKYYCSYFDKQRGMTFYFRDHNVMDAVVTAAFKGESPAKAVSPSPEPPDDPGAEYPDPQSTVDGYSNLPEMDIPIPGDGKCQSPGMDIPIPLRGRVNAGASFRDYSETTQRLSPLTPETGECVSPTSSEQEESAASRKASARSPKPKGSAPAEGKPAPRCEAKWKPDDFNRLMVAYPKRGARADAAKVWDALRPNDEFAEMLFNAACRCSEHHRLKGDNGQYAKALGVWLRGECWNDPQCQPPAPAVSRPASRPTASGPTAPCSSAAPHSKNMNDDPLYRALQAQQARWGAARKERDAHLARILPPAALYAPESLFGDTP